MFGISWNPPEADVSRAWRVVNFLEDRRVLYVPSEMEVPSHCVTSILEIRSFLTDVLDDLPFESELSQNLRAMRAACRKFLHVAAGDEPRILLNGGRRGDWASWVFNGALGELRGVFGIHLAPSLHQVRD